MATRDGSGGSGPDETPTRESNRPDSGSDLSSAHLLQRVAQRDEAAFESFYGRTTGVVAGVCRSVLRDLDQVEELIEEVSQEIFLEVWQKAAYFDPAHGSARAWVATMAYRRSVDRARSAQATRNRELKTATAQLERDYDLVSERVATRQDIEQVRGCLHVLTARQRDALELVYYDGHSQSQAADLLGIPLGTMKTRIRDGVDRLRDHLGTARDS